MSKYTVSYVDDTFVEQGSDGQAGRTVNYRAMVLTDENGDQARLTSRQRGKLVIPAGSTIELDEKLGTLTLLSMTPPKS